MLEAYFDESGSHNKRLLVMAGFVADADRWRTFEATCEGIKRDFKIEYFHSKKLHNKHSTMYEHLSVDDRLHLKKAVASAIRECATQCIVSAIIPAEYQALTTPLFRSRHGSAFAVCVMGALLAIHELFISDNNTETVSIFLEDGHRNAVDGIEVIKGYKSETETVDTSGVRLLYSEENPYMRPERGTGLQIGAYGLGDKKAMSPLWAADFAAYNIHGEVVSGHDKSYSSAMGLVEERVAIARVDWNEEKIRHLVELGAHADIVRKSWNESVHEIVRALRPEGMYPVKHRLGVMFQGGTRNERDLKE